MLVPNTSWERDRKQSFQRAHRPFQQAVDEGVEKGYDFDDFSQDLYSSLYQISPEFPDESTPGAAWAKKALDELKSLPEFKQIRETGTKCDSFQSGLGASVLTKHFADSMPKAPKEENPDDLRRQIRDLDALLEELPVDHPKYDKYAKKLVEAKEDLPSSDEAWAKITDNLDPATIRQAFRKAIVKAQEQAQEFNDTAGAFGYGTEPGSDGYTSVEAKLAIAEKIKDNEKLKQIARMAGRFRVEARKIQANKKKPGPDEITDVEIGNDLGRLLPSELMKLKNPLLKRLFYKGYTERSLMQYKLETVAKETRGPIVFCIDNSYSMDGAPECWSKALLLGIMQIALDNNRACEVIHFNSSVARVDKFQPKKYEPQQVMDTCAYFSGGGTDISAALLRGIKDIEKSSVFNKADIILISDGISPISDECKKKLSQAKENTGLHLHTILLGMQSKELEKLSDFLTYIKDFTDDEEVKQHIFSI